MSFDDKSQEKIIVQVAIDSPLNQLFDYAWNKDFVAEPKKGQIVQVSFGRQECVGVVMQIMDKTEYDPAKLKRIEALAPLPQYQAMLLQWQSLQQLITKDPLVKY